MKTLLFFILLFFSLTSYSNKLIYKIIIENNKHEQVSIFTDSTEVKNIYYVLFDQKINIKKAFDNQKLYFIYKDANYTFTCKLYYIDQNGKIKKFKKKLFRNKIKNYY